MNARRTVGMMGIAIGLATAITIGASPGSEPSSPQVGQDQQIPSGLKPVVYRSLRNDVSPRLDAIKPVPTTPQDANRVRINKILPSRVQMARQTTRFSRDPIVQLWHGSGLMPSPIANFEGIPNVNGVLPPDTQGDVGPDHYVQWVNLAFAVYNKTGTKIYPAAPGTYANGNTLWSGFGGACETSNDGDPITLFDRQAGRWLMTQFALPNYPNSPFYECFAISTTGDPTGTWYRYEWVSPSNKMNDYPKFGIWPDGYYMTVNQFASGTGSWAGAGVAVFNRDQMLAGLPAQSVYFDLFGVDPNLGGMLPSDSDGATPPPAGSPNFFLMFDDDGWGYPADQLELFKFHVDWTTPANSTFTGPTVINLTALGYPFDSNLCGGNRSCIPQPGTSQGLDPISDRLMHRMAYRNFGDHEALVFNHTVDANGSDHAGIRWYEMRATERYADHLSGRHLHARRGPPLDGQHLDGRPRQHRARVLRVEFIDLPVDPICRPARRRPARHAAAGRNDHRGRLGVADRIRKRAGATTACSGSTPPTTARSGTRRSTSRRRAARTGRRASRPSGSRHARRGRPVFSPEP